MPSVPMISLYYTALTLQAIDELIVLLKANDIDYSETDLVINEEGSNSTIEGLSDIFVSAA